MPRRVESPDSEDEESDAKAKKRRPNTRKRGTKNPGTLTRTRNATKSKTAKANPDPLIAAWTSRRTVDSLDGIEDISEVTPKKETKKKSAFKPNNSPFPCPLCG